MKKFLLLLALLLPVPFQGAVIANISTELPTVISSYDLREYFLLRKLTFPNGVKVQIYIFSKDNLATRDFLLNTLKISPSAYFDLIAAHTSTGRGDLPIVVDTSTRMLVSIAVNKGGLGIIKDILYTTNIRNIKVIEIE